MCGCNLKLIPSANSNLFPNSIPLQQVNANSTVAQFYYYRCLNADKFEAAFSKFGPAKTNEDVKGIANAHDTGKDISMFNADFLKIAQDIDLSDLERKNAHCQIGFTY